MTDAFSALAGRPYSPECNGILQVLKGPVRRLWRRVRVSQSHAKAPSRQRTPEAWQLIFEALGRTQRMPAARFWRFWRGLWCLRRCFESWINTEKLPFFFKVVGSRPLSNLRVRYIC